MADNLIFPIGFDLDKAVEQAGKDWDGKFADKLEKLIAKRPVNVKLKLDTRNLDSLDAVKKRLAELKIEPITPETKSAIRELTSELRQLAKALETLQKYSKNPTKGALDTSRVQLNEERAKAQAALAAQRAAKAEDNLAAARLKAARAANINAAATRSANKSFGEQASYLDRLVTRMAAYWSIRQIGNFLTNVREVTAQFELQRVSLGAIIQDQQRANALFSEIKSFALKSPVSIMDLTKYTKQLAAYKIGWDGIKTDTKELFDWTKKLTDVSVGLGVSMDRIVLAFGQTRATGYLRASEIRQFTEMGVPIVEELASKLSKMNGELVTAAQVMDMVSKRGISFELVKEIFDDMTSAGGMFYNMQEKQGNTLFGLWAKLGDAASVMYDEIGNTESVNKGMKEAILLLTDLMKNWRSIAIELKQLAVGLAVFKTSTTIMKAMQVNTIAAAAATRSMARASIAHRTAVAAGNPVMAAHSNMLRMVAVWNRKAALSTNLFTIAANKLKVALVSWGPMAIVAGLSLLISYLISAAEKAGRLRKELDGIGAETGTEISRLVTNFESLAKKAVDAADGSREQKDALSELQRTYRSIIPEQNLTIEKLREMKGEYTNLTIAIREHIREQQLQKGLSAISENYGKQLIDAEREFRDNLKTTKIESKGGTGFYLDERQIDRVVGYYKVLVREGKSAQEALKEAFKAEDIDYLVDNYTKLADKLGLIKRAGNDIQAASTGAGGGVRTFEESAKGLTKAIQDEEKAIADWKKQMDITTPTLGKLSNYIDDAKKKISEHVFVSKEQTFAYDQETARVQINSYIKALEEAIEYTNVSIDLSKFITIDPNGIKRLDFKGLKDTLTDLDSQWKVPLQDLAKEVQNVYDGFIPNDRTTASLRNKLEQITTHTGASMDKMRKFLMKNGDSWKDYSKKIEDSIKDYKDAIEEMNKSNAAVASGENSILKMYSKEEIETANKEMQTLILLLEYLQKASSSGRTSQSDPRLGILQEMVSTLKQVNKEYDDLVKKEGQTKALADTQKMYANTFKNMQALARQYKFELPNFGVPTDTASLTKYLDSIKKAMAKLPKSQKATLSLQVDIDKLNIDEKQKQIEEELKRLADRVSRTKAAQEFYDKILSTTGDIELAASVTMSIYGDAGTDVQGQMANYISELFGKYDIQVPVDIVSEAGEIDYTAMEKYVRENEKILGDGYKELLRIAQDGQKDMAKTYEGYLKDLEVAKTYADKRIDLARDTANKINDIEKSTLPKAEKERLKAGFAERESREAAKLEYDAFKDTPLYVQMFEDLDYASTSALTRMRDRLVALKDQWKNLDPTQLKELQKRLEEIESQLATRNPFKILAESFKKWRKLKDSGRTRKSDEEAADAAEIARVAAWEKMMADERAYQAAVKESGAMSDAARSARSIADSSKEQYESAEKTAKETAESVHEWVDMYALISKSVSKISEYQSNINEAASGVRMMMEAFGASDEDLEFFDELIGGFNKVAEGGKQAGLAALSFMSGDIFGGITKSISAVGSIISGFTDIIYAGRIRRANKEIKRQQELLDQLEYTYGRLEKSAEKVFGADFVKNQRQQYNILLAQQKAYMKQYDAEMSKGKKADDKKAQEYLDKAREIGDQIVDIEGKISERMLGTDITSAARDFAQAWLDAYKQFGNTADAMSEKFHEMIENMVVESLMAKAMQRALEPTFKMIDDMDEGDFYNEDFWRKVMDSTEKGSKDANAAGAVIMEWAKKWGYDGREKSEGFTGIAKNVAGATSEEINSVAAIGNTLMYYVSPIPRIDENLVVIRSILEGGNRGNLMAVTTTGWTDWQQQAMDNYNAIARNTAETVAECRRSAQACENIAAQFSRIIKSKGSITGVNTFLSN